MAIAYLYRALDIDLQQNVTALGGIGPRRAVQMAGDLGPLHEATPGNPLVESSLIDEHVSSFGLTRAAGPGLSTTG